MTASLARLPWEDLTHALTVEGYVVLPRLLDEPLARSWAKSLARSWDAELSESRALDEDALPPGLAALRDELYGRLVALANEWSEHIADPSRFPPTWRAFHEQNLAAGQCRSLSRVERLSAPGFSPLRQSSEEQRVFPVQMVALLSEPGVDFSGGELVMTEQRPRMQSRPMVVPLALGDVALIATARRPVRGNRGFYTVNTRHAVSRVHSGQRVGLELSFHHGS